MLGTVNGLLGGGGGMLAVPLLQKGAGYSAKCAHATAIAVILPVSFFSAAVYAFRGFAPLSLLVPTLLGVTFGGILGARLLNKLSVKWVNLAFAFFMLFAGLKMLF